VRALGLVLAAVLLAGCGQADEPRQPLEPRFATQQVAWAHLRTLHYGDQEFTLPRRIRGLAVSDYAFFVQLADDGSTDPSTTWGIFDGTDWTPLGGDPTGEVRVSLDGRYAGWMNRAGPRISAGRLREAVVADIRRGEPVLKDSSGMGDEDDDLGDLYEELYPTFLGFDAGSKHAYWTDATGSGTRRRGDLATGEVEKAVPDGSEEFPGEEAISVVVDAYRGRQAGPPEVGGPLELQYGLYSPDERFAVDISAPGTVLAYDATSGKRVKVRFPDRAQYFGGWLPGDRFFVVTTGKRVESWSLTGPDPTRGRIAVCRMPSGTCSPGARVPGLRDLVVPGTQSLLG
jgi:hypothetical protein